MPEEPELLSDPEGRWMPGDVAAASMELKSQLLDVWTKYVQTVGPHVMLAYRTNRLKELPNIHVVNRVLGDMQKIALEQLVEEEVQQDDQARKGASSSKKEHTS